MLIGLFMQNIRRLAANSQISGGIHTAHNLKTLWVIGLALAALAFMPMASSAARPALGVWGKPHQPLAPGAIQRPQPGEQSHNQVIREASWHTLSWREHPVDIAPTDIMTNGWTNLFPQL